MNEPPSTPAAKRELTIEAVIAPGDSLLAQVVEALRGLPQPPESLAWSVAPGTTEARIWIILLSDEDQLRSLVAALGQIPGVRRVSLHGPGQTIIEQLALRR